MKPSAPANFGIAGIEKMPLHTIKKSKTDSIGWPPFVFVMTFHPVVPAGTAAVTSVFRWIASLKPKWSTYLSSYACIRVPLGHSGYEVGIGKSEKAYVSRGFCVVRPG